MQLEIHHSDSVRAVGKDHQAALVREVAELFQGCNQPGYKDRMGDSDDFGSRRDGFPES
jgi:hypothetical protein